MTAYVALLRAVNVGGHGTMAMADLRQLATDIGLSNPRTLLNSGNLVFAANGTGGKLSALLEAEAKKRLGLATNFIVRTAKEWSALIAANPFPAQIKDEPAYLQVMCLKDAPTAAAVKALEAAIKGREVVRAKGNQLYAVYPDGVGKSKLTTELIERTLGTRGTARNWNTILKLAAALAAD